MKILLDKKLAEKPEPAFILFNEAAQVYCGLQGGYPAFSNNLEDAKPLHRDSQIRMIQQGTSFQLEKYFL